MTRTIPILLTALSALLVAGCGDSPTPDSVAGTQAEPVAVAESSSALPTETVAQFYEALRSGSKTEIANLLTDKAREETAKSGLGIQSEGSPALEYELGETDYVTEAMDGAHVKSLWIDFDDYGEKTATEVIWVLRKQTQGWRIAGMATQVAEGQLPLLFNFEDPEDMLEKKDYVETHYTETESSTVPQTATPTQPGVYDPPLR